MNILSAYSKGFGHAIRYPRMLLIIYAVNLIISLLVALPMKDVLNHTAGNSMMLTNLVKTYDSAALSDVTQASDMALSALRSQVLWAGFIYLLINIFFTGGILQTVSNRTFTVGTFFSGCGRNFFRFFFLGLVFLAVHAFFFALVAIPTGFVLKAMSQNPNFNELVVYKVLTVAGAVYLFFLAYVFMANDYSKSFLVYRNSSNVVKAYSQGFRFVNRHFTKTYLLLLFLIAAPVAFVLLYFYVDVKVTAVSRFVIYLSFALMQFFVISRIWVRFWLLSSQYEMFADDYEKDLAKKKLAKQIQQQRVEVVQAQLKSEKELTKQTLENLKKKS